MPDIRRGLIIVNTGPGKGKTTAAMGTGFAGGGSGHARPDAPVSEGLLALRRTGRRAGLWRQVHHEADGPGFRESWSREARSGRCPHGGRGLGGRRARRFNSGTWDLVILDEINYAISYGMLDPAKVVETLKSKPEMVHIILTGRNAHPTIVEARRHRDRNAPGQACLRKRRDGAEGD